MDVVYSLHFFPVLCTSMDKQQRAPAAYLIKKSCWILSERKISKFLCFIWTCPLWSHANFHVAASLLTSFWAKHLLSLISEVCKPPDLDPGESEVSCGGRRRLKEATEKKQTKKCDFLTAPSSVARQKTIILRIIWALCECVRRSASNHIHHHFIYSFVFRHDYLFNLIFDSNVFTEPIQFQL